MLPKFLPNQVNALATILFENLEAKGFCQDLDLFQYACEEIAELYINNNRRVFRFEIWERDLLVKIEENLKIEVLSGITTIFHTKLPETL